MRKLGLAFLISLICLNFTFGAALADGMIMPELMSPDYLGVRYHHVDVQIRDFHAITRVEQVFYNPHPIPVSGRYFFPIPPGAALTDFSATISGQDQDITWQDAATTNAQIFEVMLQRNDPSLLQYVDWESISIDIDIPAFGEKEMTLEYEELLQPSGGLIHYRYVLSTERYASQPVESVKLEIDLFSSNGLATIYSSTHDVAIERDGEGGARIAWEEAYVNPNQDFELFYAPAQGGVGSGLLTGTRQEQDHFLFFFSPDDALVEPEVLPKDIVFVIDRSGSMDGEKITQAKEAMRYILDQLNPQDRFSIIGFDDDLSVWASALLPASSEYRDSALRFVNELWASGYTNIEMALRTGLQILGASESRPEATRLVIFLTDGLPTEGVIDTAEILRLTRSVNEGVDASLNVFGVGYDVNTHLLDNLAAQNGGAVIYVQPGESLEVSLAGFYDQIAEPLLTDLEVVFEGMEVVDILPESLPDLFAGSTLSLAGRFSAHSPLVSVRVIGMAGDERREYVYDYDLSQTGDQGFVPRLWATRRIGALLDRVRVEGERPEWVSEIEELGYMYGIVTPYTTLVISPQADGAASVQNMDLYGDKTALNQASGQITVQARIQNQMYQQTQQAFTATGANVANIGQYSIAQFSEQNVDLGLLQEQKGLDQPITEAWIEDNIPVDRYVDFGSEAYLELAQDPEARAFLQSGMEVVFEFDGVVISVLASPATQTTTTMEGSAQAQNLVATLFQWISDFLRTILR